MFIVFSPTISSGQTKSNDWPNCLNDNPNGFSTLEECNACIADSCSELKSKCLDDPNNCCAETESDGAYYQKGSIVGDTCPTN